MMNMNKEREENKKRFRNNVITGLIATVAFVTLILIICIYGEMIALPVKILLVCIAVAIFISGLYVTMEGERNIGYYKCKECGELFVPTFRQYTAGMHLLATRHLKCPKCGKKSWCKKVLSKDE